MVSGVTVDGATWVMGVIGDPIRQAKTPEVINPIFAEAGANIVCVPLHIPPARLAEAWAGLKAMPNIIGFGVTLPHKQAALALCDRLDPVAERIGAVNLVRREADGAFCGYQFDGRGFVAGLKAHGHDPAGRDCLMIGAGGAAMSIAYELAEVGARSLTISNRTMAKTETLADAVNAMAGRPFATASDAPPRPGQLIINATSLGLAPDDPLPLDPTTLTADMIAAEVIAKPEITPLLEAAAARGAAIHSGIHMIRGQVPLIAAHMIALWK